MLSANISMSLIAASKNEMRTLSREKIDAYVHCAGIFLFLCPPATYRAFLVRSNLTSKIKR